MALLVAVALTACSEEQGTEPGSDANPAVTIFQYAPGDGYNADNDIKLRICANNQTAEAYYLTELTADKEENLSTMGEAGYMNYVVENGTKVTGIEGESDADVILTGLIGDYTITVVAVNGSRKTASEVTFYGVQWDSLGQGTLTCNVLGGTATCEIKKAAHAEWYKAIAPIEEGMDIVFKVGEDGSVSVEDQPIFTDTTYGVVYTNNVSGTPTGGQKNDDGTITVYLYYYCSAGNFGTFEETLTLPASAGE